MNFSAIISRMIPHAAIALALGAGLSVFADAHDDAVYSRYSHKVGSSKIAYEFEMKFNELTRPATQHDVDCGLAVFTFQGLGEARVWKLPACPVFCEWPSLKDFPFEGQIGPKGTNFDDFGYICQAEEIEIGGKWKRYFGFVSKHGSAVVPADEVYLWFDDRDPTPHIVWTQLPGGIDWGMLGPDANMQNGVVVPVHVKVGDPLPVAVYLRNRRGVAQKVLGDLYRHSQNKSPEFRKGINLFLTRAPFAPKNPDPNYPRLNDFRPVIARGTSAFTTEDTGPMLEPGAIAQQAVFDIRDWFDVTEPGYYQYRFEFDPAELGLPKDERYGPDTYMPFTVGTEPKRGTVEELNRDIPAFGGADSQDRLRRLIHQSLGDNHQSSSTVREKLPQLNHTPMPSDNGPPDEPEIVGLWIANRELFEKLEAEPSIRCCEICEALMQKESNLPMKLLLASQAAPLGSRYAALFLLDCMTNTDYVVAQNTGTAIRFGLDNCKTNIPDWLVQMTIAALSDERYVTGLQKAGWSSDSIFTMSYLADEHADLTQALGYLHCTNAVPFLIEMVKKTDGRRGPVMALGTLGDPRAIPILIELVKRKGPTAKQEKGWVLNDDFLRPVVALGNLGAKEAIPVLLDYIEFPDVIDALQEIGDPSAIRPLQKLIESKGNIDKAGARNDPDFQQKRVAAAKIAVASSDQDNRTLRLCQLLEEPSFDQYERRSVVWALGNRPDSQAIPFLAKAIKTDKSGAVVNQAITVLAEFKYKAAVDALVGSFDADFQGKQDWKRAYNPEMFRDNIAESLKRLTGQQIGADKQQWQTWWKAHRNNSSGLQ